MKRAAAAAVDAMSHLVGDRGPEVLALTSAAREAAGIFEKCRVVRAYANVMPVPDDDGAYRPMTLVKVQLQGAGKRRTVLWKGRPLFEQLLRGSGWPLPWAEILNTHLSSSSNEVQEREAEVWAEALSHVDRLRADPDAMREVSGKAAAMREKERSRQEGALRRSLRALVKGGWSEGDVLRIWREEECRAVQES